MPLEGQIVALLQAILDQLRRGGASSVTVTSSVLPTGASTSANQTTEIGHLATIAGLSKAEDAAHVSGDPGIMALAVRNDAGAVLAGTTGDYIPITTDATGAVRVTGGSAGSQFAEDTAHVSGDLGTMALAVRNDAGTVLAGTTGDYIPLSTDSAGSLRVAITSGAGSGGTSLADKGAFVEGTTSFTPVGGVFNETISADPTEDQAAAARITAKRAVHVNLRNVAGTEIATSGAPLRVDPTGTTTQPVSGTVGISGTVTVSGTVTANQGGAPWSVNQTQINGVAVLTGNGVTGTGSQRVTIASDNTAFSVNAIQSGTWTVQQGTPPWSVNQTQVNGVTVLTGNGVTGTGSPRVTIASDNTAFGVNLAQYTPVTGRLPVDGSGVTQPVSGTITANQGGAPWSFNQTQVNGVAVSTGNGTAGTGVQRVTIASDNTAFTVNAAQSGAWTVTANAGTGTLTTAESQVLTDNGAFVDGTSKVFMAGYVFDETAGTALSENDAAAARVDSKRAMIAVLEDATTRGQRATVTAANALKTDGSAVTQPVSNTVLSVVGGGTEATAQRVTIANDSTGVLSVDDNGGSLTVDGTVTANAGSGTFTISGAVTNTVLSVVGGGTEATAQRVTIASDSTGVLSVDDNGGSLTVDGTVAVSGTVTTKEVRAGTPTQSTVADNAANVTLLASNANRLGATIENDSSGILLVKLGATASSTSYTVRMVQFAYYEVPFGFTGQIDGIWLTDPNDGAARITELAA